jgi:putative peptide zinc metalloprotease protein
LGIAFLVYYLFFKLLGILLFLIEIVFFIGLPVYKELQVWWSRRMDIWHAFRGRCAVCVMALACLGAVLPWSGAIVAPGLLMAERQTGVYAPQAAIITTAAANLQPIAAGEVIVVLRSPELEKEALAVDLEMELMEVKLANMSLHVASRTDFMINLQEYQGLMQTKTIYARRQEQLTIKAPFAGTLVDVPSWHGAGQWVTPKERIGTLISDARVVAVYVNERDLARLDQGDRGFFEPDGKWTARAPLEIIAIDAAAVTELQYPELASNHGGPIGVLPRMDRRLIPETAVYKILCRVPEQDIPVQSLVGVVSLRGKPKSILAVVWQNLLGILVRESGL